MPRQWTKAQRKAHSERMKAAHAREKSNHARAMREALGKTVEESPFECMLECMPVPMFERVILNNLDMLSLEQRKIVMSRLIETL